MNDNAKIDNKQMGSSDEPVHIRYATAKEKDIYWRNIIYTQKLNTERDRFKDDGKKEKS